MYLSFCDWVDRMSDGLTHERESPGLNLDMTQTRYYIHESASEMLQVRAQSVPKW